MNLVMDSWRHASKTPAVVPSDKICAPAAHDDTADANKERSATGNPAVRDIVKVLHFLEVAWEGQRGEGPANVCEELHGICHPEAVTAAGGTEWKTPCWFAQRLEIPASFGEQFDFRGVAVGMQTRVIPECHQKNSATPIPAAPYTQPAQRRLSKPHDDFHSQDRCQHQTGASRPE